MLKKNKKILMIGPFPEPTTGVSLANKIVAEVLNDVTVYDVKTINTSYSRFDEAVGSFSIHKLLFNLSFYFSLWRVFVCDILYITPGQTFFGVLKYSGFVYAGALSRKHIITHIHGNHLGREYQNLKGLRKIFFKSVVSKTTKGIVLSHSLKSNMQPFITEDAIRVLPNFAEDFLYQDEEGLQSEELRIIYLSNLMKEKGIFDLLGALKVLEEKKVPYQAQIAGAIDKTQEKYIKTLINGLEHTSYIGVVKGAEKRNLLQWGTVFALPTFYKMEGQPISILEALASGNVILTTAHAGIPDIIQNEQQGFFIDKTNPKEDIIKKLTNLSNDPQKVQKIGAQNRVYFKENFTVEIFKNKLLDIFDS